MTKYLLWFLGILLTVMGISGNPMLLIFPMWIFTYLNRELLRRLVKGVPFSVSFIGCGVFFGLLTEVFAIINNRSLPPEKRILLSPDPMLDLIYGLFYYSLLIVTWYVLIRGFTYSKKEVFLLTGIYGILTEEVGQVFLRIFTVPVIGLLYAIIVSFVYGIFPMLAYMVSEEKLGAKRASIIVRVLVAVPVLFVEWAAYAVFLALLLLSMRRQMTQGDAVAPERRTPLPWQRWLVYSVVFAGTSTAFQPLAVFLKIPIFVVLWVGGIIVGCVLLIASVWCIFRPRRITAATVP